MAVFGLRFKTKTEFDTVSLVSAPELYSINIKVLREDESVNLLTVPENGEVYFKIDRYENINLLTVPEEEQVIFKIERYENVSILTVPEFARVTFTVGAEVYDLLTLRLKINYYDYDRNQISLIDNTGLKNSLNITGYETGYREQHNLFLRGRKILEYKSSNNSLSYKNIFINNSKPEVDPKVWEESDITLDGEGIYVFDMISTDNAIKISNLPITNQYLEMNDMLEINEYKRDTIIVAAIPTIYKCLFEYAANHCYQEYNELKVYLNMLNIAIMKKDAIASQSIFELIKNKFCIKC